MSTRMLASLLLATGALAADPSATTLALKPGDRVAVIGDSITEQRRYSRFIEVYLLASSGVPDLDVAQFGWGGECAYGWAGRWSRSVAWFKPTVATTCYGMNDGCYRPFDDGIGKTYRDYTTTYVTQMLESGIREIVVGSPGAVDTRTWGGGIAASAYNENLANLGRIGAEVAAKAGIRHADVHGPMIRAMGAAKAALGPDYHVGGPDGIHPDNNGHLVMAGAFLAALGCDGDIARITFATDGTASASRGHAVVATAAGSVELDSSRWPFVLRGDATSPTSTRSIAPYTDFTDRLNRFVVSMPGCTWAKVRIAWGGADIVVDGPRIRTGVNLMAAFQATPFDQASEDLDRAVAAQQEIETVMVKHLFCIAARQEIDADPASQSLFQLLLDRQVALRNERLAAARALVRPIRHRITVSKAE